MMFQPVFQLDHTNNTMPIRLRRLALPILFLGLPLSGVAQDAPAGAKKEKKAEINEKCPITGKAVDPGCTTEYEGKTYAFCSGGCRTKFKEARANSLYQKLGGKKAISAAVDLFYKKVLADERVNEFFDDVNMKRQHAKQKACLLYTSDAADERVRV